MLHRTLILISCCAVVAVFATHGFWWGLATISAVFVAIIARQLLWFL